jgi:hypothetical protein
VQAKYRCIEYSHDGGAIVAGYPQRKSLLPEYLIMPIISTRSHRGLHSNASWSNAIVSPCRPFGNRCRRVVEGLLFFTPITNTTAKPFRGKKGLIENWRTREEALKRDKQTEKMIEK